MPAIDYEVEYNNRARVPEHPAILARWQRDAAAFRAAHKHSELGLAYGKSERQKIDLFWPGAARDARIVLFIHGGYWRALERESFSHLAAGANARGLAFAATGYDLCPKVTISEIIEQVREAASFLGRRHGGPIVDLRPFRWRASGRLPGRHRLEEARCEAPGRSHAHRSLDLGPVRSHAAPADQHERRLAARCGRGAAHLADFLARAARRPRLRCLGRGGRESGVPAPEPDHRRCVEEEGLATRYEAVAGANHFTVLDPLAQPDSPLTARLVELARL